MLSAFELLRPTSYLTFDSLVSSTESDVSFDLLKDFYTNSLTFSLSSIVVEAKLDWGINLLTDFVKGSLTGIGREFKGVNAEN